MTFEQKEEANADEADDGGGMNYGENGKRGRKRRTMDGGRKRITRRCYVTAVYGGRFKMAGLPLTVYLEIEGGGGGGWMDGCANF